MSSTAELGRERSRNLLARVAAGVANPAVSYGIIVALQLRVIWNVWRYKDLTPYDSAHYFLYAAGWAHGLHDNIVWSPLYTDVWGTFVSITKHDVYTAEMVVRVGSVLAATVLVLALMRRLLHPAVALLVAAWWAIVPANYDPLYEVHLFGVLPVLVAALITARDPRRSSLGIAVAILAGSALLLRNELVIATVIVGVAIVLHELHRRRVRPVSSSVLMLAYGLPLAIICVLAGGMYWRSYVQGSTLGPYISNKQDLNMCQAYAFNFQQRHPSRFRGNAFTECAPLMQQTFGRAMPSLVQATLDNPRAVAGYIKWNLQLLPSGLQVALFNATSTRDQPDYVPVETHRSYPLVLSIAVLALLGGGALSIRRDYEFWRREWFPTRRWALAILGAVAVTAFFVVLTQRPRPEYMYGLTVGLMGFVGVCVSALVRRMGWTRFMSVFAAVTLLSLVVAMPSHYRHGPRPLHDAVRRLGILRGPLQRPGSVLIASEFNFEICAYLAGSYNRSCTSPDWASLKTQLARGLPVGQVLNRANASVIYAETLLLADPAITQLVAAPEGYGWRQIAGGLGAQGPWHILVRASKPASTISRS
jgi:hypothetical protein